MAGLAGLVALPRDQYDVTGSGPGHRVVDGLATVADLDDLIKPLVQELAPTLIQAPGIGVEIAGQFLVTAGDNPERLRNEAGFAMLCGAAPLPATALFRYLK